MPCVGLSENFRPASDTLPIPSGIYNLNPNDTMVFRIFEVQNLLIAAYQKRYADSIVTDLRGRIGLLNDQIKEYEKIAKSFLEKDSLNADIRGLFASKISDMKTQRSYLESAITDFKKEVKRWRRKVRGLAIVGVIAVGVMVYLYIKK